MSKDRVLSAEALAELEAMVLTAVMRSPGNFKIGEYQDRETEGAPKYNIFLNARLASKKEKR